MGPANCGSGCRGNANSGITDYVPQQFSGNLFCIEMFFGERASGARMGCVVQLHGMKTLHGFVQITKSQQAFVVWKYRARACVLDDRRPATREIAKRTIADPGVLEPNARRL